MTGGPDFILTVRFYRTESGTEPVRDWLKELPRDYRKVIGEDIKTVQYGWPLGMPPEDLESAKKRKKNLL